jgi:hypothetical protein
MKLEYQYQLAAQLSEAYVAFRHEATSLFSSAGLHAHDAYAASVESDCNAEDRMLDAELEYEMSREQFGCIGPYDPIHGLGLTYRSSKLDSWRTEFKAGGTNYSSANIGDARGYPYGPCEQEWMHRDWVTGGRLRREAADAARQSNFVIGEKLHARAFPWPPAAMTTSELGRVNTTGARDQ